MEQPRGVAKASTLARRLAVVVVVVDDAVATAGACCVWGSRLPAGSRGRGYASGEEVGEGGRRGVFKVQRRPWVWRCVGGKRTCPARRGRCGWRVVTMGFGSAEQVGTGVRRCRTRTRTRARARRTSACEDGARLQHRDARAFLGAMEPVADHDAVPCGIAGMSMSMC